MVDQAQTPRQCYKALGLCDEGPVHQTAIDRESASPGAQMMPCGIDHAQRVRKIVGGWLEYFVSRRDLRRMNAASAGEAKFSGGYGVSPIAIQVTEIHICAVVSICPTSACVRQIGVLD